MLDGIMQDFFRVLDEHPMEGTAFYSSATAAEWYGRLSQIVRRQADPKWQKWMQSVIDSLRTATTTKQINGVFGNVFTNQMTLIWS